MPLNATILQICSMRDLHPPCKDMRSRHIKSAVYYSAGICMFTFCCLCILEVKMKLYTDISFLPWQSAQKEKCIKTADECNFNPLPWEYVMTRLEDVHLLSTKVVYVTAFNSISAKLEQFKIYDHRSEGTKGKRRSSSCSVNEAQNKRWC